LEIETATRYTFFLLQVDFKYYLAPEYYEQYITKPEWQHPALYLSPDFPSGEIAGQSSAAMAVGALVFKEFDSAYADSLIVHAKV
jgi:endoglucanase